MGLLNAFLVGVKWVLVALILVGGITVGPGTAESSVSLSAILVGPKATFAGMIISVLLVISVMGLLYERVRSGPREPLRIFTGLELIRVPELHGHTATF